MAGTNGGAGGGTNGGADGGADGGAGGRPAGAPDAERERLAADHDAWLRWGPYLAERAWGTVREDYGADGSAWDHVPHDHARSRAYRWNEDGMAGVCDDRQRLCLALALWNGRDPILKERMFGLTGPQGCHGEDVKEHWWYADAVPSHAYLRWQYAYPLDGYPYQQLVDGDAARGPGEPQFELLDTGVLDPEPRGADGSARWADVTVEYAKAGPDDLVMRVRVENMSARPATVHVLPTLWFRNTWSWGPGGVRGTVRVEDGLLVARHRELGALLLSASAAPDGSAPTPLFCDNETNVPRLFRAPATTAWPKDGINDHVVHGRGTVNPALVGTKAAVWYRLELAGRAAAEVVVRLTAVPEGGGGAVPDTGVTARAVLATRRAEADAYHASLLPPSATEAERALHRAAVAGLVWGRCFYHYDVGTWLDGDPYPPRPPAARLTGRNSRWRHLRNRDVVPVPDPWEYPWYAAWDLAFHTVALARVDPRSAKDQLLLLLSERYQHPDGRLPACEWGLGDVTPPVHGWAALRVFETDGGTDTDFLARALHRLLLNVTWWLGHRDEVLLEAAGDGAAWTALCCLDLREICLRLARHDPVYADLAVMFRERFASLAGATGPAGGAVRSDGGGATGPAPLLVLRAGGPPAGAGRTGGRAGPPTGEPEPPPGLERLFDQARSLAPAGVRSPWPERTGNLGGPPGPGLVRPTVNQLLVDALRRHDAGRGEPLTVEVPAGSGRRLAPAAAADELARRLLAASGPGEDGAGSRAPAAWRDRITFHEHVDAGTGAGLGASHSTSRAALVVDLLAALTARREAQPDAVVR